MKSLESPVAFVKHLLHMVSCRLFKFRNIGHQFRCASGKGNRISVMLTCNKVILRNLCEIKRKIGECMASNSVSWQAKQRNILRPQLLWVHHELKDMRMHGRT